MRRHPAPNVCREVLCTVIEWVSSGGASKGILLLIAHYPSNCMTSNGIRVLSNRPKNPFSVVQLLLLFFEIASVHPLLVTHCWLPAAAGHGLAVKSCPAPFQHLPCRLGCGAAPAALPQGAAGGDAGGPVSPFPRACSSFNMAGFQPWESWALGTEGGWSLEQGSQLRVCNRIS